MSFTPAQVNVSIRLQLEYQTTRCPTSEVYYIDPPNDNQEIKGDLDLWHLSLSVDNNLNICLTSNSQTNVLLKNHHHFCKTSCSIRMGLSRILVNSFLHETATRINTVTVNLIYSEAGTNIDLKKKRKLVIKIQCILINISALPPFDLCVPSNIRALSSGADCCKVTQTRFKPVFQMICRLLQEWNIDF